MLIVTTLCAQATPSPDHALDTSAAAGASEAHVSGLQAPLPRGKVVEQTLADDGDFRYFIYVPTQLAERAAMFVSIHGISRNAQEHAKRYAKLAEEYGVILVAPLFTAERFPDYQRLGRSAKGDRADLMLARVIDEVAQRTGARNDKVYMFGYSGGGQFVHRYAMAYPDRVAGYVVGAAGWYTFPDATLRYPRGIRTNRALEDVQFDPDRFLAVPGTVLVGERDVHPGTALRKTDKVEAQQGATRFERGERWVAAMNQQAQTRGLPANFTFHELSRSPHSFTKSMRRGAMGSLVFDRLFGPATANTPIPSTHARGLDNPKT
jgi:poly(3-hydroxybutyrate) depolymerase